MSFLTVLWGLCALAWLYGALETWWNGGGLHGPYLTLSGIHAVVALKCP